MKPLHTSSWLHSHFSASRLYRDDLERVIGIFQRAGLKVRISDAHFEYDSLDELARKVGRSAKSLTIEGKEANEYESVSLSKAGRYIHIHGSSERVNGVAREVESIVRQRESRIHSLPFFWMLQVGNLFWWAGMLSNARYPVVSNALMGFGGGLLLLAASLGAYWLLYPQVVLAYPHEVGFWKRNRDGVVLLAVGAVFGGVIQYLLSRLLPKP